MNIAIFASGSGSNFQAIAEACADGTIGGRVVLCVASRPDAGVISRAASMGIPQTILEGAADQWAPRVLEELRALNVDLIALAGFMKRVPSLLVQAFPDRIINIHPSLLPEFGGQGMYGMNVHRAVLAAGKNISGATVHLVDEQYDTGPILLQESVPVLPEDQPEDLAARVLSVEHRLYPAAVKAFAEGRVSRKGATLTVETKRP
jgi:phosphoribosylglycinamide formyltransferase-1